MRIRRSSVFFLGLIVAIGFLPCSKESAADQLAADEARFDRVRTLLKRHIDARQIAGAVALVSERGSIVLDESVGWQDAAAGKEMPREALFRIASMSKPITSVAAMMLVEEGKLRLDDPLSKFVPEFASATVIRPGDETEKRTATTTPITVRHLLTHTSGLTYRFFGQSPHAKLFAEAGICEGLAESKLTLAENTRKLAAVPLASQPGAAWQYGMSTDVLGRVVEVASGEPFDEFVLERICAPLKMVDSHFVVPREKLSRLATLYRPGEDKTIEPVGMKPGDGVPGYSATFQLPGRTAYRSGGAGMVSTAADYHRLLTMLLRGGELDGVRLLKRETVRDMTTNQIGELSIAYRIHGDKFGYGFGVHSVDSEQPNGASPGTFSWAGVFHTYFWVDPKREVVGVLMTQLFPFNHLALLGDFQKEVYRALDDSVDAKQSAGPTTGDVYREYAVHNGGNLNWRVTDPRAKAKGAWQFLPNPLLKIEIGDLEHAVRAEATIDRWGGHLKTTDKRVRFNGHEWLRVKELETTPAGRAEYYYSQDNPTFRVPLAQLREGTNTLEGTCSTRDGYDWGQWGLYSLVLRVYYDGEKKPAVGGEIASPADGGTMAENPRVVVDAADDVERVDVLAYYDGDDENGDGVYRDWHGAYHQLARGAPAELSGHVGTDEKRPFELTWDTTWVPDQRAKSVRLIARLRGRDGLWTVSKPTQNLSLRRDGARVAIYRPSNVPENFGVRVGRERACEIALPKDAPLDDAKRAVLSLRTWHGWDGHHDPLRLNDREFKIQGNNHHYDFDRLDVPIAALRAGTNAFRIHSRTDHHMLEVLWPGPCLIVRYERSE